MDPNTPEQNFSTRPAWFYITASTLTGFAVMTVELLASRLVAPLIGNSIYTWTSIIGTTLLGLVIGSLIGGKIADRPKGPRYLSLLFLLAAVTVALIPGLLGKADFILGSTLGVIGMNMVLCVYLFLLPSTILGTIQPILLKKYTTELAMIGRRYGLLSAVWSLGSIAGVFLTGFFFISYIGSNETLWLITGVLLIIAAAFAPWRQLSPRTWLGLTAIVVFAIIFGRPITAHGSSQVLLDQETPYYRARVVDTVLPNFGPLRILFLDSDSHSVKSQKPNSDYYAELYPVFKIITPNLRDIMMIGAGGYTMPELFKQAYPQTNISVLELDQSLIDIGQKYFGLDTKQIKTIVGDARPTLARDSKKYDLIFGDAYNSYISVPWYLLTKEWTETVRKHLNTNGVYAVNFIGTLAGAGSVMTQSVTDTFQTVFPNYYVFATGDSPEIIQNIVLVGFNGPKPMETTALKQKLDQAGYADLAAQIKDNYPLTDQKGMVLTDNLAPVERLMTPNMKSYFGDNLKLMKEIFGN